MSGMPRSGNTTGKTPTYHVARGPVTDTDWCVIDNPAPGTLAPGGVVLCWQDTQDPHPDAVRAAGSAWAILRHWHTHRTADPAGDDLTGRTA